MCSWQSPKLCFVRMSPRPIVATPSFTVQLSPFSHADRSLPSNRMIASDGGSALLLPGLTTGGSFHFIPDMYSWARPFCAPARTAPAVAATAINFLIIIDAPLFECENHGLQLERPVRPTPAMRDYEW